MWNGNQYDSTKGKRKPDEPAVLPRIAKLNKDMKSFAEPVKEVQVLGKGGKYYFNCSTGDTHNLVYATGTSPHGPFTYGGVILNPVQGWKTYRSIQDTQLSSKTHLRNVKVTGLRFNAEDNIQTTTAQKETK